MRFFTSFHYVQNDSKVGGTGIWEGWFCGEAAKPPLLNARNHLSCCHSERNKMKRRISSLNYFLTGQQ